MMRVICQFKILTIIVLSFFVLSSKGQVYQSMPQYGYTGPRFNMDSTLSIPTVCGVPTLKSNLTKKAAIAFDSCNGVFYQYNPKTLAWSQISGGGGTTIDTTKYLKIDSLSAYGPLYSEIIGQQVVIYMFPSDLQSDGFLTSTDYKKFTNKVDTIYRTPGKDSIQFTIAGRYRAIKDSSSGIASRLVTSVYNNSGSTISKGSVVYINGRHSSNYPTIALAQANTEANSYSTFAMVQDDILNNSVGTVIQAGNISNLNLPTATYTDGQVVYLSPTVAGGITTTKPYAPYHIVKIGTITRAHPTLGSIELKIENGWQLDELSDVKIATVPLDSTILQFSIVDSLWHDVNPTIAMGNRFVKISDSAAMLSKYLRKTDTTNKFINSISRVQGKDSIIFYIGGTRYAIKDSIGGGGGTPAGSNGYVQFNNSGSFGADSTLFWDNTNKRLGVGTASPQVPLDIAGGAGPRLLVYGTTGSPQYLAGVGVNLGQANNSMGFFTGANSPFTIEQASELENFPYPNGYTTRFIVDVGGNVGIGTTSPSYKLEVFGDEYIEDKLITNGARVKSVVILNSDDATTYSVTSTDHIIIYATQDVSCTIYLPSAPDNGRELIIKQKGDYTNYSLTIDAGTGYELYDIGGQAGNIKTTINSQSVTLVYYDGTWYLTSGELE